MPFFTKKVSNNRWSLSTPGGVKSKSSTKKNVLRQKRLLQALDHNPKFKTQDSKYKRRGTRASMGPAE